MHKHTQTHSMQSMHMHRQYGKKGNTRAHQCSSIHDCEHYHTSSVYSNECALCIYHFAVTKPALFVHFHFILKKRKIQAQKEPAKATKMSCQLLLFDAIQSEHEKFKIHMRGRPSRKLNVCTLYMVGTMTMSSSFFVFLFFFEWQHIAMFWVFVFSC